MKQAEFSSVAAARCQHSAQVYIYFFSCRLLSLVVDIDA
jgi:hypothetical protein